MKLFLILLISVSLWGSVGNITALKGQADIQRTTGLIHAKIGMGIDEGDTILTHKNSRVQIMLDDDTILTIGPNASFEINKYLFDGTKKSQLQMRANRGFFRSVTGKIGKIAPERFKVKTASATIGIRGTDFSGDIHGNLSDFQCFSGTITVTFKGVMHEITAGMMIRIDHGNFEIHKIGTDKEGKGDDSNPASDKRHAKIMKMIDKELIRLGIPTEVIADVTIQTDNPVQEETPVIEEPFQVEPKAENRPVQY